MAHYFIDIQDGEFLQVDEEGREIPDRSEIPREAAYSLIEDSWSGIGPKGEFALVAIVRPNVGDAVYKTTLSIRGEWLNEA